MPTFPAARYRNALPRHVPFRLSLFLSLAAPFAAPPLSPIPAPFLSSITYRSVYLPSVPTPYRPCRLLGTSVVPLPRRRQRPLRSRSPIAHARVYRLRSPHRFTQPYRITPSMPPRRPDMASARLSRRMAPRGAGRASLTCQFGAGRHGSRWCQPDMHDAVIYARSRRSSGQRIPDTDIEAREAGGMRHACRGDSGQLRYRARRHIAFPAEITFRAISTRS